MDDRLTELPDFARPPITELVLGVQFARIPGLNIAHLGRVTELFSRDFPSLQEMPPLTPNFEVFGLPTNPAPTITFTPFMGVRIWMVSKDETTLLQFQADRFILNWRRVRPTDQYPRHVEMKARFFDAWRELRKFIAKEQLPSIQPNQCEISYLNQVHVSENHDWWTQPERLCTAIKRLPRASNELVEDAKFQIRYVLTDPVGAPFARMIVSFEPCIIPSESQRSIALNFTVRGSPSGTSEHDLEAFYDFGHEHIVKKFDALTSSTAHALWEKRSNVSSGQ
jgi:uncharacterized protein (TIGR04255 family)